MAQTFSPPCPEHGLPMRLFETNTAYHECHDNLAFGCNECKAESDALWQDWWDELNADRLQGIADGFRDGFCRRVILAPNVTVFEN